MTQAPAHLYSLTQNLPPRPLLTAPPVPAPYPVVALGELLGGAVSRISEEVCVPPAMAAQAVLASAALVVQSRAQVQLQGRIVPLSLYLLSVGTSGDRHTTVEILTLQAHYAWDRAQGRTHHEPCFLLDATTLERLVDNLPQGYANLGLFNDYGDYFLAGGERPRAQRLKAIATLSALWDARPLADTVLQERRRPPRLSFHVRLLAGMAPTILQDPSLIDQGLLGRCLLSWTKSLAGTRLYRELAPDHTESLPRYHHRLQALLQHPGAALSTLELDEAAYGQWQAYQADLDTRVETFTTTGLSRPMALHAADNVLRLAGILAVMEDRAAITQPVMARAAVLVDFYLGEAQRLAVETVDKARLEEAERLGRWLQRKDWQQFALRQLSREGPRLARRSAAHSRVLLDLLVRHHWLIALEHDNWALNPLPAK